MPLPVPLLLIENVGKIDPLGEQLAVSSVMVEPNWFVMGLKLAVTCAEAAPEPAIARMPVRKTPAQIVRRALIVETMVALFPSQALHRADLLLLLFDHTKEARHFFAEAERYGVGRHGFTLPIRGPAGERALFSISAHATDEHWHRWRFTYLKDFRLLADYFHDHAMRLAGLRSNEVLRPLSAREKQCLEGLLQGRAPGQMAASFDLSTSAVHAYLRTAKRKLNCSTLEQTIAKAIQLDLVR